MGRAPVPWKMEKDVVETTVAVEQQKEQQTAAVACNNVGCRKEKGGKSA